MPSVQIVAQRGFSSFVYRLLTTSVHWLLHNPTKHLLQDRGTMEDSYIEYTTDYFRVVICKNRRFHHKGNTSYQHQIPWGRRTLSHRRRC
jgi:hypothetical protein